MSERNGDKARFQKERKKKMLRRQRIRELTRKVTAPGSGPLVPVHQALAQSMTLNDDANVALAIQ